MTWLLPTLVAASLGGGHITADFSPMIGVPVVLAQDNVPTKGGGSGAPATAPAATEGGGGQAQQQQPEGGGWQMLLIMGLIFGFFWLFFIRPQNKQMKEHKSLIESLKKGDAVVTQGGILGRITGFDDPNNAVVLEVSKGVRMTVVRSQIARMQGSEKKDDGELQTKSAKAGK